MVEKMKFVEKDYSFVEVVVVDLFLWEHLQKEKEIHLNFLENQNCLKVVE